MTAAPHNIHATAISVDGIGLLFLGPSGSGKSGLAFDCLAEARLAGLSAALVSDDRVLVSHKDDKIFALSPEQIRGLIELRYTGIVRVDPVEEAPLHYAVRPVPSNEDDRLPPDHEDVEIVAGLRLPLIRIPAWSRFPLSLILARIRSIEANR
ncbi:MAG: HPr kinase/phosphorylase [Rhizobium sp.]|nr:HPr kinase/phosphorylase [Rhizobium sp.]